jgi:hypothetical protein
MGTKDFDVKFGDVLRMNDKYIAAIPSCYKDKRIMFVGIEYNYLTAIMVRKDPREAHDEQLGDLLHYSAEDVWVVADE